MMRTTDLCREVSNRTGYGYGVVDTILGAVLDAITEQLTLGHKVQFTGFGTFEPKNRAARTGRSPKKGVPVYIPPRTRPVFTPGKTLIKEVEGGLGEFLNFKVTKS